METNDTIKSFGLPSNIKQIGSIGNGLRIYLEDYAYSYIQQYASMAGNEERLALLVGRCLKIDGQQVLFISGAIQGKYTIIENGVVKFTEQSIDYANDQISRYFPDYELVGWVQSQPTYGTYLSSDYSNYHIEHFDKPYQVLMVTDPEENLSVFYMWDQNGIELVEAKGYFIYYDKNKGMNEYMLANKLSSTKPAIKVNVGSGDIYGADQNRDGEAHRSERSLLTESLARRYGRQSSERSPGNTARQNGDQKRIINMLVGFSAVLLIICFIMGAGLIQNEERIGILESAISRLNTAYKGIVSDNHDSTDVFSETPISTSYDYVGEYPDINDDINEYTENNDPSGLLAAAEDNSLYIGGYEVVQVNRSETESSQENSQTDNSQDENQNANAGVEDKTVSADNSGIPETYTVQEGDNLGYISTLIYGDRSMVQKIMDINNITDPDKIYFGKVLVLPKK